MDDTIIVPTGENVMAYLSLERIREIEEKAIEVLAKANDWILPQTTPINLRPVLEKEGLQLVNLGPGDLGLTPKQLEQIDGAYLAANKTIFVSRKRSFARQNFTIAHEIGHAVLHSEHQKDFEVLYRTDAMNSSDPLETEANWFASALLMPRYLIEEFGEIKAVGSLATIFGVSDTAMFYRLKNLGKI